jgi:hypothetical protein
MVIKNNILTPTYFIKRIPFFKDFELSNNNFKDNTNGLQYKVEFIWEGVSKQPTINIGGSIITLSRVIGFSRFYFTPVEVRMRGKLVKDIIEFQFDLLNQVKFTIPLNLPYEELSKVDSFIQESNRVCKLLSYSYMSTGGGKIIASGDGSFDEKELDVIINIVNKKLFKFEEYIQNFGLSY